jgi:integrase
MYIRAMFDWCKDERLIPTWPNWGRKFQDVSMAEKDEHRYDFQREHGERCFDLARARAILQHLAAEVERNAPGDKSVRPVQIVAARVLHACTLLAANTGANSKDIALLTFANVNLETGYLEQKRAKTRIFWQATLWPETVDAIRKFLEVRPKQARVEWADLVFLTSAGYPVNHGDAVIEEGEHDNRSDALAHATGKMLRHLGMKAKGVSFGAWRHTFRSLVADAFSTSLSEAMRTEAVNRIMAHKIPGQANQYAHLKPEQLRTITNAVRSKLWPATTVAALQARADDLRNVLLLLALASARSSPG